MANPRKALARRTRLINDTSAEIARLLGVAADNIAQVLAAAPTDYQQWRLPLLRTEIERVLTEAADGAATAIDAGLMTAWRGGAALVDGVIDAPKLAGILPHIDSGQLDAMRHFSTEKIRDITLAAMNKINDQLALTMIGEQTPFDAVQKITTLLEEPTRRRATMLVRTELATAYSTSNQLRLEQWHETIPGLKKRWIKSGKVNGRLEHAVINGQERDIDKPFDLAGGTVQMMCPHDPNAPLGQRINCGCTSVPVVPGYVRTAIDEKESEV